MVILRTGPIVKQFAIVVVANFTLLHIGLEIGWLSPVLVRISNKNQTILPNPITENEAGWLVSLNLLVGLFVIPFAGFFANHIGRKRTIVIASIPRLVACVLLIFSTTKVWILLLTKSLNGISDLIQLTVTATYCSEIANTEIRGALGTISQILSALGGMIMLTIGPFVSYQSLNIIYICLIFGTTITMLFIPESPYFLYSKGCVDKSIKVLTYLRGSEILAREEILEYSSMEKTKTEIKELFTDRVVLKTIVKVIILTFCAQIIGYNSVSYYLQTIFNSTQVNITSEISSLIIGCIQLFACFCTILLTDKLGRKPILAIAMVGTTIGMAGLGTFFKLTENGEEIIGFLNYLPLISIALVMYCFNAGIGSIQWMFIAEHFDGRFRAVGVSIAVFTTSLFTFVITKYFPDIVLGLGQSTTYYMFSSFSIFTGIFIWLFFIETKGKAFSQIQREMGRQININNEETKTVA